MLPGMEVTHLVADQLVKSIAPYLIIANVRDLNNLIMLNLAKCKIEGSTAPIKHEDSAAIEFCKATTIIALGSQIRIQRCERLVNKLHDANVSLPCCFTEPPAAGSVQLNGNCHYCSFWLVLDGLVRLSISPQESEHFSYYVAWVEISSAHMDGCILVEKSLG
jgi:hypothetical protein